MQQVGSQGNNSLPGTLDAEVGSRIKELFKQHNLTTYEASVKLGYGKSSKLYKTLSGEVKPSFETLFDIFACFPNVSADWLMLGRGPMEVGGKSSIVKVTPPQPNSSLQVLTVTVDKDGEETTMLVPVNAQAGYSVQHNEAVYLRDLRYYKIPGFEHGSYRAFEVAGDSMIPIFNHHDVVVTSLVEDRRLLEPGEVYVVVTTESVMLKRIRQQITSPDMEVLLFSDNPHRKPYPLEARDIQQLWRVRGYVSSFIPSTPDITTERLWEVIELLGHDKSEVKRYLMEDAPSDAPH